MKVITENMETSTSVDAPILDVMKKRRSRRAYADTPVSGEVIQSIFEAARWAPSSMNEQPWMYIYATKEQPELWRKIFDTLFDGNKLWAEYAPLLVLSLVRKKHVRNGAINQSARYDVGGANAMLSLQATTVGLNVHQMGGFDKEKALSSFNISSEEFEPAVVMAIGYPGDVEMLPENFKQRELSPRTRYTVDSFAFNSPL